MKYYVTMNDQETEVDIREEKGEVLGTLDGKTYRLHCSVVEPGSKYSVLIGHESLNVTVNPLASELAMVISGHLYSTRVLDERERGALALEKTREQKGGVEKSVMPGIVRKIFVTEGDEVEAGSPLLILEAMKMENEIVASGVGVVSKVHIKQGDAVNSNDPLVTIG